MSSILSRIEECIPALRRYAWALLRDGVDADDLVQECLMRAIERPPTRFPEADVRPWLFTVMHNIWASHRRKAKVRGESATLEDAEIAGATAVKPPQHFEAEIRELVRALDALPEDQRTVLLLVCSEGLSYAEVARVLDVPIGTVMSRLSRGRSRLFELTQGGDAAGAKSLHRRPLLRRVK